MVNTYDYLLEKMNKKIDKMQLSSSKSIENFIKEEFKFR